MFASGHQHCVAERWAAQPTATTTSTWNPHVTISPAAPGPAFLGTNKTVDNPLDERDACSKITCPKMDHGESTFCPWKMCGARTSLVTQQPQFPPTSHGPNLKVVHIKAATNIVKRRSRIKPGLPVLPTRREIPRNLSLCATQPRWEVCAFALSVHLLSRAKVCYTAHSFIH